MKKFAAVAALSVSALGLSAGASFADYTLNILHINDWHSRIESNNKFESTCSAEEEGKGECIGGAARLITALNQEREKLKGQNVIFLSAGDNFQGSLFYTTYKGAAELEFLNQMKLDAMELGNHEFDDGEAALVPFLDKAQFPVLGANVHPNDKSGAAGKIKPSVVLDIGGQKIGIIGGITNDTPDLASPGPNITIDDDVKAITAEAEKLKAEGVNKIIAVTHIGYPRERDVIAKIPGIDVVVGGHSHSLLSKTDPKAEGPYPTIVDNPDGSKVPVVQAASYSKYLGEIKVVFDDNGVVKEATGDPILLDKSITPDAGVLERIKALGAPIEELKNKEVSESTDAIDGSRETCRTKECAMGNLVADAILDRVQGQGTQIVFQNGGGLRASIDKGVVTMGEVLTVLPFQNTLATFELTGKDIVASLETGVSEIEEGKGKFPQVAGLKYSFDKSKKPNEGRVSDVQVMDAGAWKPIDEAKTYLVATNNFVRQGGDGYKLFASNGKNAYDYGPSLEQVVADYLTKNRPYTPKVDGRITEIAQAAAAPAATDPATPPATTEPAAPPAATDPAAPPPPAGSNDIANTPPAIDGAAPPAATPPADAAAQPPAATPPADAAATPPAATTPPAAGGAQEHVVVAGDNYWDIAVKLYGNGEKWPLIRDANPEYTPRHLPIGVTLKIPAAN